LQETEGALFVCRDREWSFQRTLAKVNYRIHTDAIQEHLVPPELTMRRTGNVAFVESVSSAGKLIVPGDQQKR
jgi:hypothetical protein